MSRLQEDDRTSVTSVRPRPQERTDDVQRFKLSTRIWRAAAASNCSSSYFSERSIMSTSLRHIVSRSLASRQRLRHLSSSTVRRKDPRPMLHTPEHIASTTSPRDIPPPEPLPHHGESLETMRARLVYQSHKRGMLESDLLLGTFARHHACRGVVRIQQSTRYIYSELFFLF
jgi:Flavinator of succinate dehydrogenase